MKVLAVLLALAGTCLYVQAQNVVCGKGTSSKTVTIEDGESYSFKTQKGKKYKGNTECTVDYKMGDTCAEMSFACTKFNTNNKDKKKCKKGDMVTITANGKAKAYCKTKKPKVTSSGDMQVVFSSDAKKHSSGAVCKVTCTEAASTTATTTEAAGGGGAGEESDCQCGLAKRKARIVGGVQTEVNEYPWQVGLVDKGSSSVWCGASLISNTWILTAAHCTHDNKASKIQALLGEHDYSKTTEADMVRMSIAEIVDHPSYDHGTTDYDFSLLKMQTTVDFSVHPHIRPICLPENDDSDYNDFVATVSGWGTKSSSGSVSSKLLEVNVIVLKNSECKNDYGYASSWITDQMLCANVDGGGKDACQGDSGGPLVSSGVTGDGVTAGQNYELIGVVSWGSGCAEANYPGVYARVSKQLDWIATTTTTGWNTCPRI